MRNLILSILLVFCIDLSAQMYFVDKAADKNISVTAGDNFLGAGITVFDYNKDGWDDISLATDNGQNPRFFKNINGSFVEDFLGLTAYTFIKKQINWVDIDNDGDYDLFLTSDAGPNKLFENDGNFNFTDISISAGFSPNTMYTFGASWGDINNDGYLDVFLSNRDPNTSNIIPNKLYKNNGNGTFTDISVAAGIQTDGQLSFCSVFLDYDKDGYQDIYIANDRFFNLNKLYKNNGNETFTEVGAATNTDLDIDAMTTTVGDYNNDGYFDIYVTNSPPGNVMLKNNGDGTFSDATSESSTEFYSTGWGAVFFDAENDGDLDLYVSSSEIGNNPSFISSAMYDNQANGSFVLSDSAGFIGDTAESYSNAIGDFNNDGLVDLVVANINNHPIFLWENQSANPGNWLKVNLEGTTSNRDGIGSTIEITLGTEKQYRYTLCGEGYLSQNSKTEFFGLGNASVVDEIRVKWLSGIEDVYTNVGVNQLINIVEGNETLSTLEIQEKEFLFVENPVNEKLLVKFDSAEQRLFKIYDLNGKLINEMSSSLKENRFDVSQISPGMYLLKITSGTFNRTAKFVKQ